MAKQPLAAWFKEFPADQLPRSLGQGEPKFPIFSRLLSSFGECSRLAGCHRFSVTVTLLLLVVQVTSGQVPYERIRRAESEPGNWLTYSGNYQSHRHSLLTQIN